ncbi:GGDEF domain-containing phosphodiesterase [Mitsuokella jalaludinii]|uniref:putative bifunctional diguanylate cyclase/phosphodiesterase n=1 Tax=Mitsuokella jalaludinii TaxID=187979 RepID=UPI00307D3CA2
MRADGSERIVRCNEMMLSLFQCSTEKDFLELTGGCLRGMVIAEDYRQISAQLGVWQREKSADAHYLDFELCTSAAHVRRVDMYLRRIEQDGEAFWSIRLMDANMRTLMHVPGAMDGLLSRGTFYQEALRQAMKDRDMHVFGSHCPVYFNITNFKLYNASCGYAAGDRVLSHTAAVLKEMLPGAILTHLAADSFLVLAPANRLTARVEQICRRINHFIAMPGVEVKAGLRFFEAGDTSPVTSSFDEAKMACDAAKKVVKRSWAIYRKSMSDRVVLHTYILTHFTEALQKGQIKVYLQPCMRVLTEKLSHVEALMRWDDPQHGLISPAAIIPVLEESGLIHELDAFMIRSVVKLLHYQKENGLPIVPVSVNLSSLDFFEMDPFAVAEEIMERYGISHEYLRFELTETAVVRDKGTLRQALQKFHRAGYHVWLDDFGSGYSSLNVLKDYPFDLLKLDMAFLKNFNQRSRDIILSVVHMAKKLGIHTLAEGVETEEQLRFLRSSGCEQIQGYYYGKPMTPEALYAACDKGTYSVESRAESHLYYHPLRGHILRQIRKVDASQTAQMMTFSAYGRSYRVTMKRIASAQALHIYQAKFEDITEELQYDDKVRQTDDVMRNL